MWRHHPQKTSFLSLFGEFFSQKQGICNRVSRFQKTVLPLGDFSPQTKSLVSAHYLCQNSSCIVKYISTHHLVSGSIHSWQLIKSWQMAC